MSPSESLTMLKTVQLVRSLVYNLDIDQLTLVVDSLVDKNLITFMFDSI